MSGKKLRGRRLGRHKLLIYKQRVVYFSCTYSEPISSTIKPSFRVRQQYPVVITTQNSRPVANGGPDQTVLVDATVQLDGSKSHDVDGDTLTFRWAFTTVPTGSTATLVNPTLVNPTFVVDKPGTYVVRLMVNDGILDSVP